MELPSCKRAQLITRKLPSCCTGELGLTLRFVRLMNHSIAIMNYKPTKGFCGASSRGYQKRLTSPDCCFYKVFLTN